MEQKWCRSPTSPELMRSEEPQTALQLGVRWKSLERSRKTGWMWVKNSYRISWVNNRELEAMNCQMEVSFSLIHMIDKVLLKSFSRIKVLFKSKMIQTSPQRLVVFPVFTRWSSRPSPNQTSISVVISSPTLSPPEVTRCWMASKIDLSNNFLKSLHKMWRLRWYPEPTEDSNHGSVVLYCHRSVPSNKCGWVDKNMKSMELLW